MYKKDFSHYKSPNIIVTPAHYDVPPSKKIRLNDHNTNWYVEQKEPSLIFRKDTLQGHGNLIEIVSDTAQTNKKPIQNVELILPIIETTDTDNKPPYNIKPTQTTTNNDKHGDCVTKQIHLNHTSKNLSTHSTGTKTVTADSLTKDKNDSKLPIVNSDYMEIEKTFETKINKSIKHVIEMPNSQNKQYKEHKSIEFQRNPISAQKLTMKNKKRVKNQKGINNPKPSLLKKPKRPYKKLKLFIDVIYKTENDKNIEDGSTINEDCSFLDDIDIDKIVEYLDGCQVKHTISNIIETNINNIEKNNNATKEFADIYKEILTTDYIENMLKSDSTKICENIDIVKYEKVHLRDVNKKSIKSDVDINCDTKSLEKCDKTKIKLPNDIEISISNSYNINYEPNNKVASKLKNNLNMSDNHQENTFTNNEKQAEHLTNSANITLETNIEHINYEKKCKDINNIVVSTYDLFKEQVVAIKVNNNNNQVQEKYTNNNENIQNVINMIDCRCDKNLEEIILCKDKICNNEIINFPSDNVESTEKMDDIDFTLDIDIEPTINQNNNGNIEHNIMIIENGVNTTNIDHIQDLTFNKNANQTVKNQNYDSNIENKNIFRNGENTEDVDNNVECNFDKNIEQTQEKQGSNSFVIIKNIEVTKQNESQVPVKETEIRLLSDNFKNIDQNTSQNERVTSLEKEHDTSNETSQNSFKKDKLKNKKSNNNVVEVENRIKPPIKGHRTLTPTFKGKEKFKTPVNILTLKDKNLAEIIETKLSKIFSGDLVFDHLIKKRFTSTIMCFKNLDSNRIAPGYFTVKMLCNKKGREASGLNKAKLLYELQYSNPRENYSCIRLYEHFNVFGHYCFVMEHYPINFKEYMDQYKKSLHIHHVKKLANQLANAVTILRSKGIVHTDIKPTHILVNSNCEKLKLCGFDQANYLRQLELCPYMGTTNYRPPEVILGHSVGYPMDVWAAALVLYEMATNKQLFPGAYNNDILFKHMCTLGNIPWDMMCNSQYTNDYFSGTSFMRKVGLQRIVEVKSFIKSKRIYKTIHKAYNRDWCGLRNWEEKNRDYDDLRSFHLLLEQMLRLNPNARLPIEFVKVNSFMI